MEITSSTSTSTATSSSVKAAPSQSNSNNTTTAADTASKQTASNTEVAAVFEKSGDRGGSRAYTTDEKQKIQAMIDESNRKTEEFRRLIEGILSKQANKFVLGSGKGVGSIGGAGFDISSIIKNGKLIVEVDAATSEMAKAEVAEDGYYGVKQTAGRILDFAKAVSQGDPKMLAKMEKAFEAGFKAAGDAWGAKLPPISQQTYDAVKKGFQDMYNEINGKAAAAN